MNNYYALIYLTDHFNTKLRRANFVSSSSPHKNVWEGIFEPPQGDRLRLVFSTTPGETALFTDSYRPPKKRNSLNFFEQLAGSQLSEARLAEGDRLLTLLFDNDIKLLFLPFGSKPNLLMIESGTVSEAFREPKRWVGTEPPEPRTPPQSNEPPDGNREASKLLLHFDRKLPRHLLQPIVDRFALDRAEPGPERAEETEQTVNKIVSAMKQNPELRVLENGHLCLIPESLLPLPTMKRFDTVNDAIRYAYRDASKRRRFDNRYNRLRSQIEKELKRNTSARKQLEQADKADERADRYEEYGHLLMASAHREPEPGNESIRVDNFYDENRPVDIAIRPGKTLAENAENYYQKASKARRRVEQSRRRALELKKEQEILENLQTELQQLTSLEELQNWEKKNQKRIGRHLSGSDKSAGSPWKTFHLRGYEIRIGKNAKSNDQVTRQAHKEDIWLHARGSGGSHVIIRMENRSEFPPREVLNRAACYAAWHSGQRGSSLVPVIAVKRKHVNKPKGAPAGTVRVSREEVLMAAPLKPEP